MEAVALEVEIRDRRTVVLLGDAVYHAVEEVGATQGVKLEAFVKEFLR